MSEVQIHLRNSFQGMGKLKKLKCQTLRRSADLENRFVLRLFITSIEERGTANEENK